MLLSYRRIILSFLLSIAIHFFLIMYLYNLNLEYRKSKVRIITDVDIIEPYLEKEIVVTPEKPKSIFNILKMLLFKKEERKIALPEPKSIEEPKKLKEFVKIPEKLIDKGLLKRKKDIIDLKELEKKKESLLKSLVEKKTIEDAYRIKDFMREERLRERKDPLIRKQTTGINIPEIGREKIKEPKNPIKIASRTWVSREEEKKIKELIKIERMISLKEKQGIIGKNQKEIKFPLSRSLDKKTIFKSPDIKLTAKIKRNKFPQDIFPLIGTKTSSINDSKEEKIAKKTKVTNISMVNKFKKTSRPLSIKEEEENEIKEKILEREESIEDIIKDLEEKKTKSISKEVRSSFNITGPLSKRKIIKYKIPSYPVWARKKGIEADVVIYFYVAPDGRVLDRAYIYTTSGFPKLDRLALSTIREWLFEPLPKDSTQIDQWGIITFRFILQ